MRDESGITLTELIVTLTVMIILAVMALPKLNSGIQSLQTRGAREQVTEALRAARQNAISTTAVYRVLFTSTTIQMLCTDGTPAGNACPSNRPTDSLDNVIDSATLNATPIEVRFDPNGAATGVGTAPTGTTDIATVTVTYTGGQQWQVGVNIPGRVRVCTTACT
jgi:Tfp pilus assembly protein FimT